MSTLSILIDQSLTLLQDRTNDLWSRDLVRRALLETTQRFARKLLFGQITQLNGVSGTSQYTLPTTAVEVSDIVYDGRSLREAQEERLRLWRSDWERREGPPQFWTTDLQNPLTLRLSPAPLLTGSTVPLIPFFPLLYPLNANLVIFHFDEVQSLDAGEGIESGLPDWLEPVAVWETVAQLCGEDTDGQDLEKSLFFHRVSEMVLTKIAGEL